MYEQQYDSWLMYSALTISLIMHLSIMRALPWLEAARAKPPIAIIAELMQPPPPPPAETPTELKPDEPITKPEVVKVSNNQSLSHRPSRYWLPGMLTQ